MIWQQVNECICYSVCLTASIYIYSAAFGNEVLLKKHRNSHCLIESHCYPFVYVTKIISEQYSHTRVPLCSMLMISPWFITDLEKKTLRFCPWILYSVIMLMNAFPFKISTIFATIWLTAFQLQEQHLSLINACSFVQSKIKLWTTFHRIQRIQRSWLQCQRLRAALKC